jgi:hypothetical protein
MKISTLPYASLVSERGHESTIPFILALFHDQILVRGSPEL